MSYWDKQPSSRIIKNQQIFYTGSGTALSTTFTAQTYQIRVISSLAGQFTVSDSTSSVAASSTSMIIPAGTTGGEYFTVSPGQQCSYTSTSTSTGTISVTEMA